MTALNTIQARMPARANRAISRRLMLLMGGAALALSACAQTWEVAYDAPLDAAFANSLRVTAVRVVVPESLTVSEANSFVPEADIVWHGDPVGDRRAQVRAIMTEAGRRAVKPLRGGRPATLDITVQQFHAVTPKTRAEAPAAVHNIIFAVRLTDARTNKPLTEVVQIKADLAAYVRAAAVEADRVGQTQKVRLTAHVDAVLKGWLGIGPDVRGSFSSVGR